MREIIGHLARPDGQRLAFRRIEGRGPCVVWFGGFASDMAGTKADALAAWAATSGRAFLRFDYFGHGESSGAFGEGTITRWRQDALAVLDELVAGPAVIVGSSMGGWIACLAALARPDRVSTLILIAPAPDFTEKLLWTQVTADQRRQIDETGVFLLPSDYEAGGLPITRSLIEDGARWSILPGPVGIKAPVRILQGARDVDAPWRHALELFHALESEDATFTLIKDGDHRLSRPQDLKRMVQAVEDTA